MDLAELRRAVEGDLRENLLPFWRERTLDTDHGGFVAEMANDGRRSPDAPKGLILNSRLLWTFSALYRALGEDVDRELAARAETYLRNHFADREHGGYLWSVTPSGEPLDASKKVYGQAFCIYALSEHHLAFGDSASLKAAQEVFRLIETHAHDGVRGGYLEARGPDWQPAAGQRLSSKDMAEPRSMNGHLHLLEAYTHLFRAQASDDVAERLVELIGLFETRILDQERRHLHHFFDEDWRVRSGTYTYGHDIEAAWLLVEAAEVLGDAQLASRVRGLASGIAHAVLEEGLDAEGGLAFEGRGGRTIDSSREWWCQAEAIVGFLCAHELSGEAAFAEAASRVWGFTDRYVVDHDDGDWFFRILPDGTPDPTQAKVSEWKGPYHTVRMCLEVLRRLPTA